MGTRTDAALAIVALLAFGIAFRAADAALSLPALALGGAGTIAFEIAASRHFEAVRNVWERPVVQAATLVGGVAIAAVGAVVAPAIVLSAGIGTLGTYLVFLSLVATGVLEFGSHS